MASLTAATRLLRLDRGSWSRLEADKGLAVAGLVAMGAYGVLAYDRFGPQAFFEPRATVRFLLTGFYGWLWLAGAAWVIGRTLLNSEASFLSLFRLYGYAHLPLLVLAITIQLVSVLFHVLGPASMVAIFVVVFWLPASLIAATRTALSVAARTAFLVAVGPYVVWLLVVGRSLQTQLGHLS